MGRRARLLVACRLRQHLVEAFGGLTFALEHDQSAKMATATRRDSREIGSTGGSGTCHRYARTHCISLLKILLTNFASMVAPAASTDAPQRAYWE
jgi:predicted DNA-binding helix-hairpin-helix protein